jgi:hypothetical protein
MKERREKTDQLIEEYDNTVYYPAIDKLIKDCEKEGHIKGQFYENGYGVSWYNCEKCGTRIEISFRKDK